MQIIISPAKTLDFDTAPVTKTYSQPLLLKRSEQLINILTTKSPTDIEKLMKISPKLAKLNVERFHNWSRPFKPSNSKQAILAFRGDVYSGLDADSFSEQNFTYAQQHLNILSGLYGLLRPLDLIQPYRLEMGSKLENPSGKNLYQFWGEEITNKLKKRMKDVDSNTLINLASNEYYKGLKPKLIQAEVVTPIFKDWKNGDYKLISFFAKKARGTMSAWLIKNQISDPQQLQNFRVNGYRYSAKLSEPLNPVFVRKQ